MDEYAAGRTPNPCLRCNEKIKFAAVLDRALALGFDAVATGHYAQLRTGADGLIEMHRATDHGKDQSYVLGVLDQEQLRHSLFPLGDTDKPAVRREAEAARPAGGRQARLARHLLRRRRRQRRLAAREARRPRDPTTAATSSTRPPARRSAATPAPTASPSASAAACASACPPPTASRASCSTSSRSAAPSRSDPASGWPSTTSPASARAGAARSPSGSRAPCSCAPTARSTGRSSSVDGDRVRDRPARPGRGDRTRSGRRDLRRHPGRRLGDHRVDASRRGPRVTRATGVGLDARHHRRPPTPRRSVWSSASCPTCRTCRSCPAAGSPPR